MTRDDPSLELPDPATNVEGSNGRSRRLFRRLCLLLLAMLVVPVVIIGYRYWQQIALIDRIEPKYLYRADLNVKTIPRGPEWLRERVGEENMRGFEQIVSIAMYSKATANDLKCLSRHPLEILHLFETELTASRIEPLCELRDLKHLELGRCAPISDSLMKKLAMLENLKGLQFTDDFSAETIEINRNQLWGANSPVSLGVRLPFDESFTPQSLRHLQKLSHLKSLSLRGMDLTDDYLVEIGQLTQLESLDLSNTAITDQGLLHLAKLPKLSELRLRQTSITDDGVKFFVGHSTLRPLDLTDTNITNEGFEWLQKHLPHCEVIRFPSTISIVIRR